MKLDISKFHPGLSVDCVLFGFHQNELKVLLLELKNSDLWALPGGFVEHEINVDDAAVNVLKERTGLTDIFLQQFHFFGDVGRGRPEHVDKLIRDGLITEESREWFEQRFNTVGYYALVEYSRVKDPQPDHTSSRCTWQPIHQLPQLMLDHNQIVEMALRTLKKALNDQPIGMNLLPDLFSMPELQALYETVLDKKLDRRNFRRKMLSYEILERTEEKRTGGAHKPPVLFKFNKEKYEQAVLNGFKSDW